MDPNRLTEKAQDAVRQAQSLAQRQGHSQIEVEHLAVALLGQDGGIASRVVDKAGGSAAAVLQRLQHALGRLPRVSGPGAQPGQVYVSPKLNEVFTAAEAEAQRMKDEFVSVEHLLLALAGLKDGAVAEAFRAAGLTREKLSEATAAVRGGQRVTSPTPEGTYESLEKYGRDLTARAREGKLDPVIGRDEEIRRVIQILSRRTKNNPVLIGSPGVGKTAAIVVLAVGLSRIVLWHHWPLDVVGGAALGVMVWAAAVCWYERYPVAARPERWQTAAVRAWVHCHQLLIPMPFFALVLLTPPLGLVDSRLCLAFDVVGTACVAGGLWLRLWTASHSRAGKGPRGLELPRTGPYAYMRHPRPLAHSAHWPRLCRVQRPGRPGGPAAALRRPDQDEAAGAAPILDPTRSGGQRPALSSGSGDPARDRGWCVRAQHWLAVSRLPISKSVLGLEASVRLRAVP